MNHGIESYLLQRLADCTLVTLTKKTDDHLTATADPHDHWTRWFLRFWGVKGCLCQLEFRLDQTTIFLKLWPGYISLGLPEKEDKPVEEFTGDISDLEQLEKDLTLKLKEFPWADRSKAS